MVSLDAEAENPILWPPHAKSWLTGKDPDAGRDWGQEEKGTTEDEMAGWHHRLDGREFEWTPGVGDGQGGLACCYSWDRRVGHDWATELNWTDKLFIPWRLMAHVPFVCCFPQFLGWVRNMGNSWPYLSIRISQAMRAWRNDWSMH